MIHTYRNPINRASYFERFHNNDPTKIKYKTNELYYYIPYNNFLLELKNQYGYILFNDVIPNDITDKLIIDSVNIAPKCLKYINNSKKTYELCLKAVNTDKTSIEYVPKNILFTNNFVYDQIDNDDIYYLVFRHIDYNSQTPELCEYVIRKKPHLFNYVRKSLQTQEMCDYVVEEKPTMFSEIKKDFQTQKMCDYVVKKHPFLFQYVREDLQTSEMCEYVIHSLYTFTFQYIRKDLQTREMCDYIFNRHPYMVQYIREDLLTPKMIKYIEDEELDKPKCEISGHIYEKPE